jgi:hypothetical protein
MGVTSTQGFKFKLVANDEILDLFHDETIYLSDNITGLFDLGVLPADFTRQITLPGTKKNNNFFEFVYDISVENPYLFSTNQKVSCYLDFDGIYLSAGYMQLNKVNVLANKFVDSYEVTVYGGLASFGRDLKRYFLTDLTSSLSQYNHTASFANISSSWGGNLFNGTIVYPMAEYGQRLEYQSSFSQFGIQSVNAGLAVQDYKPAIKMKTVFDACFSTFGYTYTSSFMNEAWIDNIYMVCNNKLKYPVFEEYDLDTYGLFQISPLSGSAQNVTMSVDTNRLIDFYNIQRNPGGNLSNELTYSLDFDTRLRGEINLNFAISGSSTTVPLFTLSALNLSSSVSYSTTLTNINDYMQTVQVYNNGQTRNEQFELLTQFNTFNTLPAGDYQWYLSYTNYGGTGVRVVLNPGSSTKSYLSITKVNQGGDNLVMDIPSNMPFGSSGIKLIDFITSIQKKFNLVIYPNKTKLNEFIIEPFNRWYKTGVIRDFNRYINLDDKIEVIPANNLAVQNLNFGDTLDGDYISQQFAKAAGREFGKAYYVDQENFFSQGDYTVKTTMASSPLVYLSGTGISGSATPTPPSQIFVGRATFTPSLSPSAACSPTINLPIYTVSGTYTAGEVAYSNASGTQKILGLRYFTDLTTKEIYPIDSITAVIGTGTGTFCP